MLLIVVLAGLIYVPAVQDFVVPRVLDRVNAGRDTIFAVGQLRLRFPLDLTVSDAAMIASGDTAVAVRRVHADVAFWPLLNGRIRLSEASLDTVFYRQGTPDSTLYMLAHVHGARLSGATVMPDRQVIDLDRLAVRGVRVDLTLLNDTTVTPPDTSQVNWRIHAREISLADVGYRMQMLPTIDTLAAHIGSARLTEGNISLADRTIDVQALAIDSVNARYLLPDAAYLATHPADTVTATTADTLPARLWTIRGNTISLTNSAALYAVSGASPRPGLDLDYISVSDVNIEVDSLYNRGTDIIVPLRRLTATERCGLTLTASGTYAMDSAVMEARGFELTTMFSRIRLDAAMGTGDFINDPTLPLRLDAEAVIGLKDIELALPSLEPMLANMPHDNDITARINISGTTSHLDITQADIALTDCFSLALKGEVRDCLDIGNASGQISIDGRIRDGDMLKPTLLQARTSTDINIPPLRVSGGIRADRGTWSGDLKAVTHGGTLALDGRWNSRAADYDVDLRLDRFPVNTFMPTLGVRDVTVGLTAHGHGYNPMSAHTSIKAHADVIDVAYLKRNYTAITADAVLSDGNADVRLVSDNTPADFTINASGNLSGSRYDWNVNADIRHLDLHAIGLTDSIARGSVILDGGLTVSPDTRDIAADLSIRGLTWQQGHISVNGQDIGLRLSSADTLTTAGITNRDMRLSLVSPMGYDSIMARMTRLMAGIDSAMTQYRLNTVAMQRAMPPMTLDFNAGRDNILHDILAADKMTFDSIAATLTNDSLINLSAHVLRFATATTRIDSISLDINQLGNTLVYKARIDNRPGTMDGFAHVIAGGFVSDKRIAVMLRQRDIHDRTGYAIGLQASIDSARNVMLQIVPTNPVIAYKNWTVNDGNFINFNMADKHFAANLEMKNAESLIHVYTGRKGDTAPDNSLAGQPQQDVNIDITDVKLQDWLSFSPFAPPVKGDLSAALKLSFAGGQINGKGSARLDRFFYGKKEVGTFDLGLDLTTLPHRALQADISLGVNGRRAITASGVLNDSTAVTPMDIGLSVDRFPLSVINPFMPAGTASVSGTLSGDMRATGRLTEPILDGWLAFDSTAVNLAMTGTAYRLSDAHIPVDSNIIRFDTFAISGTNMNPLTIDGTVDATSPASPLIDLHLLAKDFGVVNSSRRAKGADVYGKAYVDLDAKVRGPLSFLSINASLDLLPGTNVTYVLDTDVTGLTTQADNDMVRFVNFNDTTTVVKADTIAAPSMMMNLDALLTISDGSTVSVDLSADGKNKAQVKSTGTLNMHIDPMGDMRMTGRVNINEGFVRYTPPFMSEKLFDFIEGSYVAFNGDIMNPLLNIHAVDRLRANVTQEGQNSRLIYFDVALDVTGSLNNMNVAFDLSTDDDITVENELQSMSPEQRANQAMNLLLYNMYTGKGTSASSNLSGNMLYSFLASQLNNWAASNIKGVDISFGIDQYDRTVDGATSQTMSYSYRVSKSLFNDRFKIIVGGNYSTDADADENFSQNLINDISFEYLLNRAGTMYVKLFRHTGYESILEGEITQTGVGFIYKRKMLLLRDLFRPARRRTESRDLPQQTGLNPINPKAVKRNEDETTR